jgi:indolepyruvate decarboxylase
LFFATRVLQQLNADWVYNELVPRNYHALPAALGSRGWFTAKGTTPAELDAALARDAQDESARCIEILGGRMDIPAGLSMAHQHLGALY